MAFKSLYEEARKVLRPGRHGGRSVAVSPPMVYATNRRVEPKTKKEGRIISMTLSADLMREAGFKIGDQIDVGYDPDTKCGRLQKRAGGLTLHRQSGNSPKGRLRATHQAGISLPVCERAVAITDVQYQPDCVLFFFPEPVSG